METLNKKTLLMGSWCPPMMGAPIHLYNIFSRIDPDRYVVLTRAKVIAAAEGLRENWLASKYFFCDRPDLDRESFRQFLKAQEEQKREAMRADGSAPAAPALRSGGARLLFVSAVRALPFIGPFFANLIVLLHLAFIFARSARRIVKSEGIEMMLALSDDGPAMLGVLLAHFLTGKPFALYLFDLYRGNALDTGYGFVARVIEPALARRAALFIVTNEQTAQYYKKRYGEALRTLVVHNSVVPSDYPGIQKPFSMNPPFTIVFTGLAYWPQQAALRNLVDAVGLLKDLPLRLDLYIPSPPRMIVDAVSGAPNIRLSVAPQSQMPRIQSEATMLFLPLSWNSESPDIVATATPSKFTAYLASGRPMLVHAPEYACVSRVTKDNKLGLVVDRDDVHFLAAEIRRFLLDSPRAEAYVKNAWAFFLQHFDADRNAEQLAQALNADGLAA